MLKSNNKNQKKDKAEMSFIDHLEHLRWHLIRSFVAIFVSFIIVLFFVKPIVSRIILAPTTPNFITYEWLCKLGRLLNLGEKLCVNDLEVFFISTKITEQFVSTITIGFVLGFVVAFPYIFWEMWRFIKPALTKNELQSTRSVIFWVSFLFFLGVLFGYFILTPFMINFYFSYSLSEQIDIKPTFRSYLTNLIYTTVMIGFLFQLPLLITTLARIGIIGSKILKKIRKHAFVCIIILAAFITPTTDPLSLTLVTLPLYGLFESSIILVTKLERKRMAEQ